MNTIPLQNFVDCGLLEIGPESACTKCSSKTTTYFDLNSRPSNYVCSVKCLKELMGYGLGMVQTMGVEPKRSLQERIAEAIYKMMIQGFMEKDLEILVSHKMLTQLEDEMRKYYRFTHGFGMIKYDFHTDQSPKLVY